LDIFLCSLPLYRPTSTKLLCCTRRDIFRMLHRPNQGSIARLWPCIFKCLIEFPLRMLICLPFRFIYFLQPGVAVLAMKLNGIPLPSFVTLAPLAKYLFNCSAVAVHILKLNSSLLNSFRVIQTSRSGDSASRVQRTGYWRCAAPHDCPTRCLLKGVLLLELRIHPPRIAPIPVLAVGYSGRSTLNSCT